MSFICRVNVIGSKFWNWIKKSRLHSFVAQHQKPFLTIFVLLQSNSINGNFVPYIINNYGDRDAKSTLFAHTTSTFMRPHIQKSHWTKRSRSDFISTKGSRFSTHIANDCWFRKTDFVLTSPICSIQTSTSVMLVLCIYILCACTVYHLGYWLVYCLPFENSQWSDKICT